VVKKSKYVEEPFHSEYRLGLWHAWDKQTPQEQWNSLICSQKGYILMANIKRARECDAVLRANNKHTICEIIAMVMNIGVCPLTRLTLTTPISDEYILAALRSRNTTHPTKED